MDEKQTVPTPRTEAEINQHYAQCAMELGDKQFKVRFLANEVQALFDKMLELNAELGALKNNTKVV